ncbi:MULTISPECIES: CcmD family protein [unclassified Sphingobacterium]|uniref:CcmD family protein n=1 Tax=unclassified Sphingobacterium TaxID=2609468 RepID=UPI0025D56C35|nr:MULTISPECIES: CcmD family protein [unclassified Sphingobacterium]
MKKIVLSIVLLMFSTLSTFAQEDVDMATGLRSEGKIYVVVLVMLVIFLGLAFFLFLLDRRISKLEKKNK